MTNLESYKVFYKVAELKSITKTAEYMHISQPAISKTIKNLEEELNTPLFTRTRQGVVLNEAGEKIFLNVKQAFTLLEEAEIKISEFNNMQSGTIKLGISTTLAKKYLVKYVKDFHSLYPNITIDIYTDPTKKLIESLKNGELDFIIGKFPTKRETGLSYLKLGSSKYIFVTNYDYYSKFNNNISAEELTRYPLLLQKSPSNSRATAEKYFSDLNIKVDPIMNIGSANLLCDFLVNGLGIGYVTKLYVEEEIKNKRLFELNVSPETEQIEYGLILLDSNILPHHIKVFIDFLKKTSN